MMSLAKLLGHLRIYARFAEPGLMVAVILGGFLRFTRVGEYDNSYYTATVSSAIQNVHNFFFASFDPVGLVMVDKPPISFWVQSFFPSIFGVSGWSVTISQAIIGTLAIIALYWGMSRVFGRLAGIVAALALAVLPVSVVIDSRNEPDSLLSFTLLLAAIAIMRAVQTRKWHWLLAFGLLMGIGFNTKMLVAFVPLPVFLLYYILAVNQTIRQTVVRVTATVLVLVVASASWAIVVALTPSDSRPYVGSTQDNRIQTLVFEYNGINRFSSFIGPRSPQASMQLPGTPSDQKGQFPPLAMGSQPRGAPQQYIPQIVIPEVPDRGLLGLFSNPLANQLGWFLPVGLLSLLLALLPALSNEVYRRPTKIVDVLRASPVAAQAILWGGWLAIGLLIFGLANSTTTHPYYLVGVAVPLAATIGIGVSLLFGTFSRGGTSSWFVVCAFTLAAAYQVYGSYTSVGDWTIAIAVVGVMVAILVATTGLLRKLQNEILTRVALTIGASSLLVIPMVSSFTSGGRIVGPVSGSSAQAMAYRQDQGDLQVGRLSRFLIENGWSDTEIVLGTVNAREAAPFIIAGIPSIAIGGFSGNDPILDLHAFKDLVLTRGPQYFLMPDRSEVGRKRGAPQEPILAYIRSQWGDVSRSVGLPPGTLYRSVGQTNDR